jgi:N utilization substance protein B
LWRGFSALAKSRRKAREAALKALYKIELAKSPLATAVEELHENSDMAPELTEYAERLVRGVREHQGALDRVLSGAIQGYDYNRVVIVDKNVLRIGAYELFHELAVPPAVIIDEAIEIARKYSTIESGGFVNGVLDQVRKQSPKANWDPASAPVEFAEEREPDEPVEIVEETVEADSDEAKKLARIGGWTLRSE